MREQKKRPAGGNRQAFKRSKTFQKILQTHYSTRENVWIDLSAILLLWFVASTINVIAHNMTDGMYSGWNLWVILNALYMKG